MSSANKTLRDRLNMPEVLDYVADGVYVVDTERRISARNKAAERITGFAASDVQGRSCADSLLTHTDGHGCSLCKGMCPLAKTLTDGEPREAIVNLHHKAGHRIPVQVVTSPVRDDQGRIIGAVETFRECSDVIAMHSAIDRLKQWGCIDLQSGLVSRRVSEDRLAGRILELQRFGWPFGIILVELDLLQEIKAKFGDEGVTQAIRMAAMSTLNSLRTLDTVGRWDEKTFIAIVANTISSELAAIAERVRMMVDTAYRVMEEGEMHVTVSIGAAAAGPSDNVASLLLKAEKALYASRTQGRNRVTVSGAQTQSVDDL